MHKDFLVQFDELRTGLSQHPHSLNEKLMRILSELTYARQLCSVYPEESPAWLAMILEAGHIVDSGLRQPGADVDALIHEAEGILAPISSTAKSFGLLCVGHAHIDMNWQWSWPETVGLTHDTFQTMLLLMDEFPDFIFSQSQASVYALIEKYNPVMFDRIRQRVREGRWEVTASQWVEGDKNLASGESISRHLLYTREYFYDKFNLSPEDVRVDFEPDTFGHPASLPSILSQGGVRYYYHCRGSRGPHLYWWLGDDDARILVFNDIQWYMHFDSVHRNIAVEPNMADPLIPYFQETGFRVMPVLYGVGDHGGGPTRKDLHKLLDMQNWPIYPSVKFSTLHNFFEQAEHASLELPEIRGERNFVFAGCYTSQARQKEANRHGENLLYSAEAAASIGEQLAAVSYPYGNLESAWRQLLFDQFHDILPGSGVRVTRHYTLGHAQDVQAAAMMARTNALRALSQRVNTEPLRKKFRMGSAVRVFKDEYESGISLGAGVGNATGSGGESAFSATQTSDRVYMIFNALPHQRNDIVKVKLWDTGLDINHLVVNNDLGDVQPVQMMGQGRYAGHQFTEVAFPVSVPPLGYTIVCVSDRCIELGCPEPPSPSLWDGAGGSLRTRQIDSATMENSLIKLRLDSASGSIVSLVDKRNGREWISPEKPLGMLQFCLEANQGMTAWVIGQFMRRENLTDGGRLDKINNGPYIQTYRWARTLENSSSLTLDITLVEGAPRIEYNLRVDWRLFGNREKGIPHLKVLFPLAIQNPNARFDIPFGSIYRDLNHGEEVPAQRWVDFSEADGCGMTLVNTSKYGFSVEEDTLNMTLLRGSMDPDPMPDLGEHIIQYALVVHDSGWSVGNSMQVGEEWNIPLDVLSTDFHPGELPTSHDLVKLEPTNVRLAAIKKSQDSLGLILRLYEVEGESVNARISLAPEMAAEGAALHVVDTLEQPVNQAVYRVKHGACTVPINAHSIITLKLKL
ncbi:MAG: glycoside hydrolase family 38 C-terminal domain-containing protein [Anaerolineae bacterium]|nr:glycoside hydrolase family 38 C-terminal domain-containing protein [Anaerolineae bacterium]